MSDILTHETRIDDPVLLDARIKYVFTPRVPAVVRGGEALETETPARVEILSIDVRMPDDEGEWVPFMQFLDGKTLREIEDQVLTEAHDE